jgi:hypothetical protein
MLALKTKSKSGVGAGWEPALAEKMKTMHGFVYHPVIQSSDHASPYLANFT